MAEGAGSIANATLALISRLAGPTIILSIVGVCVMVGQMKKPMSLDTTSLILIGLLILGFLSCYVWHETQDI